MRLRRFLCWLGLHSSRASWSDDGKGNAGIYEECRHCHKAWPL